VADLLDGGQRRVQHHPRNGSEELALGRRTDEEVVGVSEQVVPITKGAQEIERAEAMRAADELLQVLDEIEQAIHRARACAYELPAVGAELDLPREGNDSSTVTGGARAVGHAVDTLEAVCLEALIQLARYRASARTEHEPPARSLLS
jgi:hypothetical protein